MQQPVSQQLVTMRQITVPYRQEGLDVYRGSECDRGSVSALWDDGKMESCAISKMRRGYGREVQDKQQKKKTMSDHS